MSLVITAMSTRARSRRQSASVSAVFPEPTGPPIPILSGFGITTETSGRRARRYGPPRRAEHHRVMPGRAGVIDRAREAGHEGVTAAFRHARRLPSHLETRGTEFRHPLHRVQTAVHLHAAGQNVRPRPARRVRGGDG